MKKFWNWKNQNNQERTLFLNGTIAEESWFDDDITPQLFKNELLNGSGDITVWINSPGGDCVAAAQIYNMLIDYPHDVTVKIDGIAASAASVIASDLNKRKIPTKRGGKWSPSTIRGMITNEKYMGDAIFQKTYTDSSFNRHINDGEYDQYLSKENHEPIINYEDFEKANAVLKQHGKEKGIEKYSRKSQNRYTFSGRIKCSECGSNFKRRMRYTSGGKYVVWCCSKHLQNVNDCSMKYITDEAVKIAFVTMMNKLIFAQKTVLKPLLQRLKGMNDKDMLLRIEEIETLIEKNMEQRQVLTSLMAKKCLEPALYNKESNALTVEAARLREERESLIHSINGDRTKIDELQKLVKFTAKGNILSQFDDGIFLAYVERIEVLSCIDIEFELKCGLQLKERLVD